MNAPIILDLMIDVQNQDKAGEALCIHGYPCFQLPIFLPSAAPGLAADPSTSFRGEVPVKHGASSRW